MKIGIDIRVLQDKYLTGVGLYTYNMLDALAAQHSSHFFFLLANSKKSMKHIPSSVKLSSAFTIVNPQISNKYLNLRWKFLGTPSIEKILHPVDIMWYPNLNFIPTFNYIPYTITIHDLSFLHDKKFYSYKRRLWHKSINPIKIIQEAHMIYAVSQSTKKDIEERIPEIDEAKIKVIYPGIYPIEDQSLVDVHNRISSNETLLVYLGTIEPRKNLKAVLKSFDIVKVRDKSIVLAIAGSYGWSEKKLFKRITRDSSIIWLKYLPQKQKFELLRRADLLVWPSHYEGFGFPPLEAIAHNVQVITSYKTSLPEILQEHAIYVNPYNPSELAQVIAEFVSRRHPISEKAVTHARQFNWDTSAKNLLTYMTQ